MMNTKPLQIIRIWQVVAFLKPSLKQSMLFNVVFVILSIFIFRIVTAASTKTLQGCSRITNADAAVNCIRIERVHTTPPESCHNCCWCHGFFPKPVSIDQKLVFGHDFARIILHVLITQFLPVLFQWFEHTGIQWLRFMGSVGWETGNDYVMLLRKTD